MLSNTGFDLWADGYDKSVGLSDENGRYPFVGYRAMMNALYHRVLAQSGTGVLTSRLYERGCHIYGQVFSARMIELAQAKMPEAKLYQGDFSNGLVPELCVRQYDAIVATYSLHHLTDAQKIGFLRTLLPLLKQDGCIFIGDVAFRTRVELEACRNAAGDEWDGDEIYFVYDELRPHFPALTFESFSHCTALLTLRK